MWHKSFPFFFVDWSFVCVLQELIFVIRTDWFSLLQLNFCNFQRTYLAYHITIKDLENFIETKFAETLH